MIILKSELKVINSIMNETHTILRIRTFDFCLSNNIYTSIRLIQLFLTESN